MATYVKLASATVGSGGAADIEFTNIDQTYDDLVLKLSLRNNQNTVETLRVNFNSSNSNYTYRNLFGDGAAVTSSDSNTAAMGVLTPNNYTASTFGSTDIYIPNYTSSTNKSISSDDTTENNATTSYASIWSSLWSNTSAITSIKLFPALGSFVQYSTATLYGIKRT